MLPKPGIFQCYFLLLLLKENSFTECIKEKNKKQCGIAGQLALQVAAQAMPTCSALPVLKVQAVMTSPGHVCTLHLRA